MGTSALMRVAAGWGLAGAVLLLSGCSNAAVEADSREPEVFTTATSTVRAEPDTRLLRFTEVLEAEGLVADVPEDTLLAVVRGVCDRLAEGVPEADVAALVQPVAAYAATASDAVVRGDEAAHRYVVVARDTYC